MLYYRNILVSKKNFSWICLLGIVYNHKANIAVWKPNDITFVYSPFGGVEVDCTLA